MVHALLKVQFTSQPQHSSDVKDALTLCDKIIRKFSVLARAKFEGETLSFIVISTLKETEQQTSQLFHRIIEYCDMSEFGRVYETGAFIEQIDEIDELDSEHTMEYAR